MEDKTDKVHYIVFYRTGEIKQIPEIETNHRLDKLVVFKRKFIKTSGGKGEYSYHTTEVLNKSLDVSDDKSFYFGEVKCKIVKEQYWAEVRKGYNPHNMFMDFEITDLFNKTTIFRVAFGSEEKGFMELKSILDTVGRVGSIQGTIEIRSLEQTVKELKEKLKMK